MSLSLKIHRLIAVGCDLCPYEEVCYDCVATALGKVLCAWMFAEKGEREKLAQVGSSTKCVVCVMAAFAFAALCME